jgi:hypothetical protein
MEGGLRAAFLISPLHHLRTAKILSKRWGPPQLIVNKEEANRVQSIFALFLESRSLASTLEEIHARGWTTKCWRTRGGKERVGRPFMKVSLRRLLSNILYLGKVSHQAAAYAGEQPPIIDEEVWRMVREKLAQEEKEAAVAVGEKVRGAADRRSKAVAERAERVPRIARLLALALKFEELMRSGTVSNYASLAPVAQVSRSRITQMTSLLNLAPDIQEEILFLPVAEPSVPI